MLNISDNDLTMLRESSAFDAEWYSEYYRDVSIGGIDPAFHYLRIGWLLGRQPSEGLHVLINPHEYLAMYPDVMQHGMHPVAHYLAHGMNEGRRPGNESYSNWINTYDSIGHQDIVRMKAAMVGFSANPLISIIMPTYNTPPALLREAIASVRAQIYENWQLCIADDNSSSGEIEEILRELAAEDPRIAIVLRPVNGHISECSNSAIELAKGTWLALMDHDDVIPPQALYCVVKAINEQPDVMLIYSDEDKLGRDGRRQDPYFKPDWNLELFRGQNFFSHFGVYRTELVRAVGGFRSEFDGSQDYDLALRCMEKVRADQIRHIPKVLYHWRVLDGSAALSTDEKPYAVIAGQKALNAHLKRTGVAALSEITPFGYKTNYTIAGSPHVSVIIPTRDRIDLVKVCIDSMIEKTNYANYSIIVVDNASVKSETFAYFDKIKSLPNVRIIRDDRPFNFSALNNLAAKTVSGGVLCLLNNDIEIIDGDWMEEMLAVAQQPDVGAVGAKLFYPDGTIQHAGVVMGIGGVANHAHCRYSGESGGYFARLKIASEFSAVTGACLMVRKEVYDEAGGLNERDLAVAYNDVDFCLRLKKKGLRNVFVPYAALFHHESASRGRVLSQQFYDEQDYMFENWSDIIANDPGYNPNLTATAEDFSLASPPRVQSWW